MRDSVQGTRRPTFGGRFSIIAVAVGSAIGLGNIWKFPYITGKNGGAAFILVYLACITLIGLPVLISDFIIGRRGGGSLVSSFRTLSGSKPFWIFGAFFSLLGSVLVLSFYGVVAGWSFEYIYQAISGGFAGKSPETIATMFADFSSSSLRPAFWQLFFMLITSIVVFAGVKKGIEGFSRVMMPVLLGIILLLCLRSVTLPGAGEGLSFLFRPDFSKLSAAGFLDALGHAFFTLSLGVGTMITYASYIDKKENLAATAVQICLADTIIALLAGVAIFPAVFAFGLEPAQGPGLVFITLPNVFMHMPGGYFFSILFFILLALAALSSSISMLEVSVAYVSEDLGLTRKQASVVMGLIISLIGLLCTLSMGGLKDSLQLFGMSLFDATNYFVSNIEMPIAGALSVVFVIWIIGKAGIRDELSAPSDFWERFISLYLFVAKYIAPLGIAVVFLRSLGLI